jgi:RecJ-like exonuclease
VNVHRCPACYGTGLVSRPPWVAGDVDNWVDYQCGPYPCRSCDGKGVLIVNDATNTKEAR